MLVQRELANIRVVSGKVSRECVEPVVLDQWSCRVGFCLSNLSLRLQDPERNLLL